MDFSGQKGLTQVDSAVRSNLDEAGNQRNVEYTFNKAKTSAIIVLNFNIIFWDNIKGNFF